MQLTKLRAAPVLQAEVPPCAPDGQMDGGTASQLIRSVRRAKGERGGEDWHRISPAGRSSPMARRSAVAVSGSLLSISGLIILVMAGNETLMSLFGSQALSAPGAGDAGWVGVGFTRLFGAALASLGLVMMATRPLSDAAAKTIGGPLFAGLGLLTLVT